MFEELVDGPESCDKRRIGGTIEDVVCGQNIECFWNIDFSKMKPQRLHFTIRLDEHSGSFERRWFLTEVIVPLNLQPNDGQE
jgi:hypothetical protein